MTLSVEQRMRVIAGGSFVDAVGEDLDSFIEIAEEQTNRIAFSQNADQAVALRACHMIKMMNDSSLGGEIISEKVGKVSYTYAKKESSGNGGDEDLTLTRFGKQYITLRDSTIVPLI